MPVGRCSPFAVVLGFERYSQVQPGKRLVRVDAHGIRKQAERIVKPLLAGIHYGEAVQQRRLLAVFVRSQVRVARSPRPDRRGSAARSIGRSKSAWSFGSRVDGLPVGLNCLFDPPDCDKLRQARNNGSACLGPCGGDGFLKVRRARVRHCKVQRRCRALEPG